MLVISTVTSALPAAKVEFLIVAVNPGCSSSSSAGASVVSTAMLRT